MRAPDLSWQMPAVIGGASVRILLVGETGSIHVARWANQLCGTGWDVHLFQAGPGIVCPELACGTVHLPIEQPVPVGVTMALTPRPTEYWARRPGALAARVFRGKVVPHLAKVIEEIQPDVVHSLGLNHGWQNLCLPVLEARTALGARFNAPWVYSSYGQDFVGFRDVSPAHRAGVVAVLEACDYYIAECDRDARLANEMGFQGEFLGHLPAFGGVDLDLMSSARVPGPTSARRTIYLKGSDNTDGRGDPIGRAMTAMRAFQLCADHLRDYRVIIGQTSPSIAVEAPLLHALTGLDVQVLPVGRAPHDTILRAIGASRVMMAITINDGLPSTLVEAMTLGALPLHSNMEPIAEWVENGVNGLLVDPEDPASVAEALLRAVREDSLVDTAAATNARLIKDRLSTEVVHPKVLEMYRHVSSQGPTRPRV